MKVCFPINTNEGMESIPYNHFGSAKMFIVVDSETREVKTIDNGNLDHEHGKCQPIKALRGEVVDAIVVSGIGQGAISKLKAMGIKVFKANEGTVAKNID
ncbi:NifB/NifX family molybdenum-iron cluster-binding protein, partial [Clostridium saudiense]|nr:NifB/NifX family molybdenum-iron cluster-binding protein [Clostridium saudiense]